MNRLAVETATDFCSVALEMDGEVRVREKHAPRGHAELLVPWMRELLAEGGIGFSDLDGVAVSRGPGGFTSLRIGLGVVQGVALAHELPVYPVSALAALARAANPQAEAEHVLAILDARMSEVYSAWFRTVPGGYELIGEEQVDSPSALVAPHAGPWLAAGSGMAVYGEQIEQAVGDVLSVRCPNIWPDARSVLLLAETVEPVNAWQLEPTYVRDRVTDQ
jgi:tRNA threonylcarbamoyladenosine biosynthesis protein TsaB